MLDTAASRSLADLIAIVGDPARVSTVADYTNAQRLGVHLANAENDSTLLAEGGRTRGELGRQGRYAPRIERTYPLKQIVEAHAHAERGPRRGKILICI